MLSPVFQPWYALWPLALLAATTVRTNSIMLVAVISALSVLPNGGGLARFVKFPGAPLMTIAVLVAAWLFLRRRRLWATGHRQPIQVTRSRATTLAGGETGPRRPTDLRFRWGGAVVQDPVEPASNGG